ncbi:unnamed protein product, partial [Gulo gulo]
VHTVAPDKEVARGRDLGEIGSHSLPPQGLPLTTLPSSEAVGRDSVSGRGSRAFWGPWQWGQGPQVEVLLRWASWGRLGHLREQRPKPRARCSSADHMQVPPPFSVGSHREGSGSQ